MFRQIISMNYCLLSVLCVCTIAASAWTRANAQNTTKNTAQNLGITTHDVATFSLDMRPLMREYRFTPAKEKVGIRGSIPPFRWDSTLIASDKDGDSIYTLTVKFSAPKQQYYRRTHLGYKFKVERPNEGQYGWETGENSTVNLTGGSAKNPQSIVRAFNLPMRVPMVSTKAANVVVHEFLPTRLLPPRNVWVYLPPNYATSGLNERYPVLYMHDGQNIFDDSTSANGEWHVDEIVNALITTKKIPPIIIVGIQTRPAERMEEYTPSAVMRPSPPIGRPEPFGGKGPIHARMLIEEIKPFIDTTYRTLADKANTSLGGSSLGGLMTMYTGISYPNIFGQLAVISPSVWWDGKMIIRHVMADTNGASQRVWLDIGDKEGAEATQGAQELSDWLVKKGWTLQTAKKQGNLAYSEVKNASHSETAWGERFDAVLLFLYGKQRR
jgi:predicted alpha/beta superfamily hydrolase